MNRFSKLIRLIYNNYVGSRIRLARNLIQPVNVRLDHIKDDHKHINLVYFGVVKGGTCREIDDEGKALRWFSKEEVEKEDLIPNVKEWAIEAIDQLGDKH